MFKLHILVNYPDDKEIAAATPKEPIVSGAVAQYIAKLLDDEVDLTSVLITITKA